MTNQITRCPDCGVHGEREGHQTCQYPGLRLGVRPRVDGFVGDAMIEAQSRANRERRAVAVWVWHVDCECRARDPHAIGERAYALHPAAEPAPSFVDIVAVVEPARVVTS